MSNLARLIIFWPGITNDITQARARCKDCNNSGPSQAPLPTTPATPPSTPFEKIFADYFDCAGSHYLVIGDRLSGWSDVFQLPHRSSQAGADGLTSHFGCYFARFVAPVKISSNRGLEFVAKSTEDFLQHWGDSHRLSSAYNAQSNGGTEVAVKSTKRFLWSNTGRSGTLNTNKFLRAMMQLHNTPDPDCNISPAIIVFSQPIRDAFPFINRQEALRERFHKPAERLNEHARELLKLSFGDWCYLQNQTGNHLKHWDCSGTVVEIFHNKSYGIKTRRKRLLLHKFIPTSPVITYQPSTNSSPTTQFIVYDVKTSNTANELQTGSKTNECSDNRSNVLSNTPPPVAEPHDDILLTDIALQQSQQHQPDVAPADNWMCLPTENTVPSDNGAPLDCPKCLQWPPKRCKPEIGTWLWFNCWIRFNEQK